MPSFNEPLTTDRRDLEKAARCGEPSYVWRAGQQRRLSMIAATAGARLQGHVLENGCGVGMYLEKLAPEAVSIVGLEYDYLRAAEARQVVASFPNACILNAAGEALPFPSNSFDLILSHEVLEHVADDRLAAAEMARVLRPGGRMVVFVPNRGYPFETHGVYWRGTYRFGNIPLVNYLPRRLRDQLAPHVRVYSAADLEVLFAELPLRLVERRVIFGAYDNIIARRPEVGRALRSFLQAMERTPLRVLGLSHFWVLEKLT
jgi:SAM-dependent methyltransferase